MHSQAECASGLTPAFAPSATAGIGASPQLKVFQFSTRRLLRLPNGVELSNYITILLSRSPLRAAKLKRVRTNTLGEGDVMAILCATFTASLVLRKINRQRKRAIAAQ